MAKLTLPPRGVDVEIVAGSFDTEMATMLDAIGKERPLPIFAFVDPFGYSDDTTVVSSRILGYRNCEVLIYVPLWHIARFVSETGIEDALDNLYGDRSWAAAREVGGLRQRIEVLAAQFEAAMKRTCRYVRAFEINEKTHNSGYFLFFGTNDLTGLSKMKYAMWKVDPVEGQRFVDNTDMKQTVMFGSEPDYECLLGMLRAHFGTRAFSIEDAELYTLVGTPFREDAHLKRKTLAPAERAGTLLAELSGRNRKRGTYPEGTCLRFRS